jgi:hypothetical protein
MCRAVVPRRLRTARYDLAMAIDLHTHSTASDGTDSPGKVVADAKAAGLDVVALTDHDTVSGWAEAEESAREHGIALVRGAELSSRATVQDHGAARSRSVHMLSYLHDPSNAALHDECEKVRSARRDRALRMVELLARDYPITWDDVVAETAVGTTVGRPHLADALVRGGYVADRAEAFATVLRPGSPYYVPHYAPPALEVVATVRAAGGVPVLAHPAAARQGPVVDDATIAAMADAGLAGLEVDHRDHTPEQRVRLAALADRLGIFTTGSSDYHGAGKPNRLGENTTAPHVLEQIEEAGVLDVVRP